jgi:hypothetical protein
MTSQHHEPTLSQVQEEFGHHWLCWPGPSGTCYALQLDLWHSQGDLSVIQAIDPAGLRDQLRSIQEPSPPPLLATPGPGTPQPVTGSQHTPPRPRHPCPRPQRHHRKQPHGWQPW